MAKNCHSGESGSLLPQGWVLTKLNDVLLKIVGGGTPSKSIASYYQGNIPWMTVKDMKSFIIKDTVDHISSEAVSNSSTNIIPAGTPIVATRMSLGKIVLANFDSAINQDLKGLFPSSYVATNYLIYWYRSNAALIEQLGTGTTVKGIRLEVLRDLDFQLPPLAEQKVIAKKLDTLLAQVEHTQARLQRIPEILKRFRQSVLADAVSGKLTGTVNSENFQQLGNVDVEIKTGPFGSALHKSDYVVDGIPVINPMHIAEGIIYPSNNMSITKVKFNELANWQLRDGDIIVGRRGEMGRAATVTKTPMLCGTGSMFLRPGAQVNSKYLEIILRSPTSISFFNAQSVGTTMVNLNQKIIKSLKVYFPPLEEQSQIVARVEQLFAYADRIEQQAQAALERVNLLSQSILAKAFRGELTAYWRAANPDLISGDNSAEALLTKIQAARKSSNKRA